MAGEFTRSEFHELVWSTPMTGLAKQFALSDVALHKICRKHDVPTPPPGWWAKQQAGRKVRRMPLPPLAAGMSDSIVIAAPELRGETPAVAAVREAARVLASDRSPEDEFASDPIVERTVAMLRSAAPSPIGIVVAEGPDVVACEVAIASVDRVATILRRVAAAATHQGFRLEAGPRSARFAGEGETIGLSVAEQVRRTKHVLTLAEQKLEDVWRRKSARRWSGDPWDEEFELRPCFPDWDYLSTGQLGLEMEKVYVADGQGPRATFRDAKIQRLDVMASDVAVAMAVLANAKREERERRAEAERIRLDQKRERERPLRERHVQEPRREGVDAVLADVAALERFRDMHGRLIRAGSGDASPRVAEFLRWADEELKARKAAFGPEGLERRFAEARLFGEDDDHSFIAPLWF